MSSINIKPNGTVVVTVRITLHPGKDDFLIGFIRSAPRRSRARFIVEAMRNGASKCDAPVSFEEKEVKLNLGNLLGGEI